MTVKELIDFLQTMPQDAIVIQSKYSDWIDIELDDFALKTPKDKLIRHNGHLMILNEKWWPEHFGPIPKQPEYLTALRLN